MAETNIESLTRLQVLNLRENKFKDLDSLCSSIKSLASLHALEVVGNPVCPTDTTDDRSKLLAGMLHLLEATQLPLRVLNAKEITIAEMCAAISKASGADKAKTEEARLELCFQRLRVKISTETLCLSGFQYSSVKGLQALQNLTSLDLSSNKLRKMEVM
jgi:Leucine-rich repeat (LRR) protein